MKNFVYVSPHFPTNFWKFCLALKNKGWNVLGIGDALYNDIPEQCKYSLTEYYCCHEMEKYENEKKAVEYYQNKYGHIDFLESNNEFWLIKDAKLRTDFNITSGANNEEVKKYRYKSEQKQYFKEAGCPAASYALPKTLEEAIDFANKVGYPFFSKPNDGVGAQGSKKINSLEELKEYFPKIEEQDYIFEQFIDGQIVSFDGICNSKSEVVFCTQNVFLEDNSEIVAGNLDDSYYCNPYMDEKFKELGERIVKAFGIKQRFFHIELFKLKKDHPGLGKKGDYVALEANMRPAGGYTTDLINFANSISCYDIYADVVTCDNAIYNKEARKYYAITSSRRNNKQYKHSTDEVLAKYQSQLCMFGEYPLAIRDDMGDYYFFAKFDTLEEALAFDNFVRGKVQ